MDFVLKFLYRPPGASASKYTHRVPISAPDRSVAIAKACEMVEQDTSQSDGAMLFVVGGDVVWISEGGPKG